jgi:hypothetical protein
MSHPLNPTKFSIEVRLLVAGSVAANQYLSPVPGWRQAWAAKTGWALVWSLAYEESHWGADGFPGGNDGLTSGEDRRLLDLSFLASNRSGGGGNRSSTIAANLTAIGAAAGDTFMAKWAAVGIARRELEPPKPPPGHKLPPPPPPPPDPLRWAAVFGSIADSLPRGAALYPLSAASCADVDRCIGVADDGGDCVCYSP